MHARKFWHLGIGVGGLLLLGFAFVVWKLSPRPSEHRANTRVEEPSHPILDGLPPRSSGHLRVRLLNHDGAPVHPGRVGIVELPVPWKAPIQIEEVDARGEAVLDIHPGDPTTGIRVIGCSFTQDKQLLWVEKSLERSVLSGIKDEALELRFSAESTIKGTLSEIDGKPVAQEPVVLRFGWIGGPGDPMMEVFARMMGETQSNRWIARTDENGAFQMFQIPGCISFTFFGGGSDPGHACEIETDLPRVANTRQWFQASQAGTYHVTIRRWAYPVFRLRVRFPDGAQPNKAHVQIEFVQLATEPLLQSGGAGHLDATGTFAFRMPLLEGTKPASLHGNKVWIAVDHPDFGTHFFVRTVDARTFSDEISVLGRAPTRMIEGFLVAEDGSPFPGLRLTLRGAVYGSRVLGEHVTDERGYFKFDGLVEAPAWWTEGQRFPEDPSQYILHFEAPKKTMLVFDGEDEPSRVERSVKPGIVHRFVIVDLIKRHTKKP